MRDFTCVDACSARLKDALEREADLQPAVIERWSQQPHPFLSRAAGYPSSWS
jgi:hypothetical protein